MKVKRFYYFWETLPQFLCLCPWIPATDKAPPPPKFLNNRTLLLILLSWITFGQKERQKIRRWKIRRLSLSWWIFRSVILFVFLGQRLAALSQRTWYPPQNTKASLCIQSVLDADDWGSKPASFLMASSHILSQKRPHNNRNGLAGFYPPAPLCAFLTPLFFPGLSSHSG